MFIGWCALLLAATGLQAQLTLTIDTINKTWWWTGSASTSGTLDPGALAATVTGGGGSDTTYSIGSGHLNFSSTGGGVYVYAGDDIFYVGSNGFYVDPATWSNESGDPQSYDGTVTGQGSGSPNYYGGQSATVISYMESWDGMTIYFNGASAGSVSVVPAPAVPEPSAYALAVGIAALGCVIARRQRSSKPGIR